MTIDELNRQAERILAEVERAVVGKRDALELVLLGILADGHVLIEDFPGLAKTLIARSFAAVTGMSFSRIQFTPDLMPADVTGSSIYRQQLGDFEFRPGPIFANLLLADEINRAPPKTQAALLEAMQERQVTIEGETRPLEPPFVVLATQNPIEYEGTYPLPEAQLDRFLLRIGVGYPAREHEWEMLDRRLDRAADEVELSPVVDRATLVEMQRAVENVHVEESLGYYIVDLAVATRSAPGVQVGASPRGSLALLKLARCRAALSGRDFATPDDVKAVAVPALAHRLTLRPELWVERRRSDDIVRELLERVPTPAVSEPPVRAARAHADQWRGSGGSPSDLAPGVSRSATGKLHVYVVLAGLGLLGGLTLGRPELVAIAAPFALFVALGLVLARAPSIRAGAEIERERQLEGRHVDLFVEVSADRTVARLELLLDLADGLVAEAPNPMLIRLARGERRELEVPLLCSTGGRIRSEEWSGARKTPSGCSSTKGRRGRRSG